MCGRISRQTSTIEEKRAYWLWHAWGPHVQEVRQNLFISLWENGIDRCRACENPRPKPYICTCVCVCIYVYVRVCVCICMYACMYIQTYVYRYYVLINPPIPFITSSRCKRLHNFRPVEILLHERGRPRVPLCNVLKMSFIFFKAITLYFCVLFEFCFTREGAQGPPLVNPLNNVFSNLWFIIFFKKDHFENGLKTCRLYILYRYTYIRMYNTYVRMYIHVTS